MTYVGLNLLRGLAAILVCLGHLRNGSFVEFGALPETERTLPAAIFFGICRLGHEAVLVFFVLSGFLVGGALLRSVRNGDFSPGDYLIDRATRIWLPLLPACLLTDLLNIFIFSEAMDLGTLLGTMAGLNGVLVQTPALNGPLWSLAYEIWFYIFGGALACAASREQRCLPVLIIMVCAVAVFTVLHVRYLAFWGFGALASLLLDSRRSRLLFACGLLTAIMGSVLYQISRQSLSVHIPVVVPQWVTETLLCAGFAATLPAICSIDRRLRPLKMVSAALSAFSFSLYLTHAPIGEALQGFAPREASLGAASVGRFAVKMTVCLLVAALFCLAFERPTARLRRILKLHLRRAALAV